MGQRLKRQKAGGDCEAAFLQGPAGVCLAGDLLALAWWLVPRGLVQGTCSGCGLSSLWLSLGLAIGHSNGAGALFSTLSGGKNSSQRDCLFPGENGQRLLRAVHCGAWPGLRCGLRHRPQLPGPGPDVLGKTHCLPKSPPAAKLCGRGAVSPTPWPALLRCHHAPPHLHRIFPPSPSEQPERGLPEQGT